MHVNVVAGGEATCGAREGAAGGRDTLAEIDEIGVQVKDLEQGLLDFPCVMDGKTVLLCWKLGEKEIGFWHDERMGLPGRKPLDARFGKTERERLN